MDTVLLLLKKKVRHVLYAQCLVLVSVEFQERSKRNNLLDAGKQAIRRNKTWPSKQPFYGLCHLFDILNANTQ
jgi:hypothetical protein